MTATIQRHRGDLDAAESACADMQIDLDEITPIPSSTPSSYGKRTRDPDSDVLDSLQQRLAESGTILKELSKAQQHPAFVNYVKDSLLTMSKPKYKKARSSINSLLSELMDEDSDYDIPSAMEAPPIKRTQQASHSQPPLPQRPISAPPFCSFTSSAPSFSEHYQKPPYMSINEPPASSVWGSQSMEYMDQFHQPIVQHQHHHRTPTPLEQMMVPPQQLAQQPPQQTQQQQQQCTPTPAQVCDSLGSAAQVLREKPEPTHHVPVSAFEHNLPNICTRSTLSGFQYITGSPDDIGSQDEVLNQRPQT